MSTETQPPSRRKEKERVQLDFSHESLERLDALKERIGASTRAEAIRQALRLFEWFINETDPTDTIQVLDREGELISKFKAGLLHSATRSS